MPLEIREPVLVIGLGGAGSRLASEAAKMLGCDSLCISNDAKDIEHAAGGIHADTGAVINPTIGLVRTAAYQKMSSIRQKISSHSTVLLVGNLAGKAGCAISPVITEACMAENADVISFAIMPFGYEKSKIFASGVALKRLRESSKCLIILDNDALSETNPDMTPKECYAVADAAIMHVLASIDQSGLRDDTENILVASRCRKAPDESLRDVLKALYGSVRPGAVMHSILYAVGGENMPVGMLRAVAQMTEGITGRNDGTITGHQNMASAEIATVSSSESDESRIVMLSTVQKMTKFEGYDPLGSIPKDMTLDWDAPECSINPDHMQGMYQME